MWNPGHPVTRPLPVYALEENITPHLKPFHQARQMDRSVQFALLATQEAWHQAGLESSGSNQNTHGVLLGTSRGPVGFWAESHATPTGRLRPSASAYGTLACLSGAVASSFGLNGPSMTVSAACSSSAHALLQAAQWIHQGWADLVVTGGSEAPLLPMVAAQLDATRVLSHHPEAGKACRPFSPDRDGMVLGEGAGVVILESEQHARERGAHCLGILGQGALTTDRGGRTGVSENAEGLLRAMRQALNRSGLTPEEISLVSTHGTGTRLNDQAESLALRKLFEGGMPPLLATKTVTGHCLGATSALEWILALNFASLPDPGLTVSLKSSPESRPPRTIEPIRHILSSHLGFWAHQSALVLSTPSSPH